MDLNFLYGLKREGIKMDLEVMRNFAPMVGNPQDNFSSFHIAGTNGKGSTSAFIYNILMERFHTGLYTSPHLVKFNERIVVDRNFILDTEIEEFMDRYTEKILNLQKINRNPTFFETTTMLAFDYFSRNKVSYASVEVGLGGRLDSTNIITPLVSTICNIGYEHFDRLGCSLDSIAFEKGGIVKPGIPFVLADDKPEVVSTLKRISDIRTAKMHRVSEECRITSLRQGEGGLEFIASTENQKYDIETRMLGDYQVNNILAALLTLEIADLPGISRKEIERGIRKTVWPARMEILSHEPFILLDCAHNPPAARALVNSYRKIFTEKIPVVMGMLSDKDWYSFARTISEISDSVIFTTPDEPERALSPDILVKYCGSFFSKVKVIPDPAEAYEYAKSNFSRFLVTGSIYLVGRIKEIEGSNLMPYILN